MENILNIVLFGERHKFKTNLDPDVAGEVVGLLVNEVSRVENSQAEKATDISKVAILIIAALNIAKDNLELKNRNSTLVHQVCRRSDNLIKNLDACLEREMKKSFLQRMTDSGTSEIPAFHRDRKKAGLF